MDKQWVSVVGFEGIYEVSDLGNIKRVIGGRRKTLGRILKPLSRLGGYCRVCLYDGNGRCKDDAVHRIVARAFLGVCPKGFTVNHVDGNKANNKISNLEYLSHRANIYHAIRLGLMNNAGANSGQAKLTQTQVDEIRAKFSSGLYKKVELAREFNISPSTIKLIVTNKTWLRRV